MLVETLHPTELELISRLQKLGDFGGLMKAVSDLGPSSVLIGLLGVTYLCWDSRLGARLLLVYFTSGYVSYLGKLLFHSPRPYWVDSQLTAYEPNTTSYGFPSGHALMAACVWFLFAHHQRRRWAWWLAGMVVFAVCFSRVYLASHFISDVVGGVILGTAWLWLFLRWERQVEMAMTRKTLPQQAAVCVAVTGLLLAVGLALRTFIAGIDDPTRWVNYPGGATSYRTLGTYPGALLGLSLGLCLAVRWIQYDARGPILHLVWRVALLGIPGLIYWFRPKGFMKSLPDGLSFAAHFGFYALATCALAFAIPWLYQKLGIAKSSRTDGK